MSSKRSSRKNKPRSNHIRRANNILVFKLVDPICQSLLFILFIYCLDSDTDIQYQMILQVIVAWQILSSLANLFLKIPDQFKKERLTYLAIIVLYTGLSYFIQTHVQEKFVIIKQANNISIPIYESILETGTMLISFWYYVICFREIRAMLTSVNNEAS